MTKQSLNVLFLCTGNSARSIMAESLLNSPLIGGGKFRAYSAGSHPKGEVNPLALEVLQRQRMPIDGLWSKSWDEFARADAPKMDFVFTVCDDAANEVCPVWPGQPVTAHWGLPDPAAIRGTDQERRRAFLDAFLTLKRRVELFASLPMAKIRGMELLQTLEQIGREQTPAGVR